MQDLSVIREQIDDVDAKLRKLYEKRLELVSEVAAYKLEHGKPVLDAGREQEKLATLTESIEDVFLEQGIKELFEQLMSASRKKQYGILREHGQLSDFSYTPVDGFDFSNSTVVYQGVEGAYSQAAMLRFFDHPKKSFAVENFRGALEVLQNQQADYAIIPIENSTAGVVETVYDLLNEYQVSIIGEEILPIEHALLALPNTRIEDIRIVYSHPQAIRQCERFLSEHPHMNAIEVENTAMAAKRVYTEKNPVQAAIAGAINAKLYDLKVLQGGIQDECTNETRFIVLSAKQQYRKDAKKITMTFELPHERGSLYHAMSNLAYNGINLTMIQSRPIRKRNWEYRFFIDFDGNLQEDHVQNALVGLREETVGFRILGNY